MSDPRRLLTDLGITYRQLDHWCSRGWVPDLQDDQNPGTGVYRKLQPSQVQHLRVMARLVHDGLRPDAASRIAVRLNAGQVDALGGFLLAPEAREPDPIRREIGA